MKKLLAVALLFAAVSVAAHATTSWTFCWTKVGPGRGPNYVSSVFQQDYGYGSSGYDGAIYGRVVNQFGDFIARHYGLPKGSTTACYVPLSINNNQKTVTFYLDDYMRRNNAVFITWP
jgi:hypothetical protein